MKVADLTVEKMRDVIREVVDEKLREFLVDPDFGLELREETEERLADSISSGERISLDEVKRRIGLSGI